MKTITIEIAEIHDDAKCPEVIYWKIYRWYRLFGLLVFKKLYGIYDSFEYMDYVVSELLKKYNVIIL